MTATAAPATTASTPDQLRARVKQLLVDQRILSAGALMWLNPPKPGPDSFARRASVTFGSNVDANDPEGDLAAGQSETAIAAQQGRGGRRLVMVAWNDISGAFALPTTLRGSGTGVAVSDNGGHSFTDLIGLPNHNPNQQWVGDPTVVSLDDGVHFAVGSLYFPSVTACSGHAPAPAEATVAVSIATVFETPQGPRAHFSNPIKVAAPGNLCELFSGSDGGPPSSLALLDKDWMSYDPTSRTLAVSFTRVFFGLCRPRHCAHRHSGLGRIDLKRAHLPADPTRLSGADFGRPTIVWSEERNCPRSVTSSEHARCGAINEGAYVSVAPGGRSYVAWERNWVSNLFDTNGNPYIFDHVAVVPAGADHPSRGGPKSPIVITKGQRNATPAGGVKSLDSVLIPGYSRGFGNDYPRLAIEPVRHRVVFVWNDASRHPLGDIWMRTAPLSLSKLSPIRRVNDDNTYALHFLPAVSVRKNGRICTSWYDRRFGGPMSTLTNYYADCRANGKVNAKDLRISTRATNWSGTGSWIDPNFGDYTDNASVGGRTYFTWTDGRIGVPQPFVDSRASARAP